MFDVQSCYHAFKSEYVTYHFLFCLGKRWSWEVWNFSLIFLILLNQIRWDNEFICCTDVIGKDNFFLTMITIYFRIWENSNRIVTFTGTQLYCWWCATRLRLFFGGPWIQRWLCFAALETLEKKTTLQTIRNCQD